MRVFVPIILIVVLLSSGCLWPKKFELVDFEKKASDARIELRASLNDSLFQIDNLRNYCSDSILATQYPYRWWYFGRDELFSTLKGPTVTFTLVNRTANELSIPFDHLRIGQGADTVFRWPDITVVLSPENGQKEDILLEGFNPYSECHYREKEHFWLIAPGDSIAYYHPLDVFLYANKSYDSVQVDKYRVQIIYTSKCWKKSNPEIWIGQARSEWMEFRVVAD